MKDAWRRISPDDVRIMNAGAGKLQLGIRNRTAIVGWFTGLDPLSPSDGIRGMAPGARSRPAL